MKNVYLLVDCNNFYVSCERAFNPSLEHRPVVVLSSNDGCCVSRSQEAKLLGIPMGVPLFKIKELVKKHKVVTLSSNYELYGDMSHRVMHILESFVPHIEHYSIDEAFIPVEESASNNEQLAILMRQALLKQTGIPVSIGIGTTRTLAKAANEIAKNQPLFNGVFSFIGMSQDAIANYLKILDVGDVWGIGRKSAVVLKKINIRTAHDLQLADERVIRKYLKIMGNRTQLELQGVSCHSFSELRMAKKGICSTRSFGQKITALSKLEEAVATYIDTACTKLRKQHSVARTLTVHIRSSYFSKNQEYFSASKTTTLPVAVNYTPTFISQAMLLLRSIYKPGVLYAKAGVYLTEISPESAVQQHLLYTTLNETIPTTQKVSHSIDSLRKKFGTRSIRFGTMGIAKDWLVRCRYRSNRYTTQLSEVLVAH